jgi:murein DD-endopeptidase MepM/ murein hydrolase activator NlpD
MSSKAEKTSHHSYQQPRLSIFFRNPLLLKIVAWLGSLSFIGSAGIVWADLQPISTATVEAQSIADASVPITGTRLANREVYGPYLPISQPQTSVRVAPNSSASNQQLPNREVPVAVTPGSAAILPTGTIVRPQHTDVLTADNYTVGVSGSTSAQQQPEAFVNILVPAPLSATIPSQVREVTTQTRSQVRPNYINPQSAINQSIPTTSIQPKASSIQSGNTYRSVPEVTNLPTLTSISPRSGSVSNLTPTSSVSAAGRTSVNPVRTTVLTPMKPATLPISRVATQPVAVATIPSASIPAQDSIEIAVPSPRTQRIEVQPVARLPQVTAGNLVPTVSAIPTVRPATAGITSTSQPIAFTNNGENQSGSQLIYPLTSPVATTSGFGWRTHPITGSRRFHSGVDLGAPMGAPVVATGSGIVVSSGWLGGYGKAVVIQHNGVQQTLYGHLSEVFVQPGQRIEQGMAIGRVGSTGNSTGPHLHFETRVSTSDGWVAIDPGEEIKYAVDNLRRSMPFAQRELSPGIN